MLASIFASLLTAAAFPSPPPSSITVVVDSKDSELKGKGISAFHEEAGLSTAFISDTDAENKYPLHIDEGNSHVYFTANADENLNFYLGETHNTLTYTLGSAEVPVLATFGQLSINGSGDVFYVCPGYVPVDDYHYAEKGYKGISVFAEGESHPDDCEPVTLTFKA